MNKYNIDINNNAREMRKRIYELESEMKYYSSRCYDLERTIEQIHNELSQDKKVLFSIDGKDTITIVKEQVEWTLYCRIY